MSIENPVIKSFEDNGYKIVEVHGNNIVGETPITIKDPEGYLYKISYHWFSVCIKRNSEYVPSKFFICNPYSTDNLNNWLRLNNKPFSFFGGNYTKYKSRDLSFKCDICGNTFISSCNDILSGKGCSYCAGKTISKEKSLAYKRPDLLLEWDYAKNKVDPESVFCNSGKKFWWKCQKCKQEWQAEVFNRTKEGGTGCPNCSISHGETRIRDFLDLHEIEYDCQKRFDGCRLNRSLPFDFYIIKYNICVEYQGEQHYNVGCFSKDKNKMIELFDKQKRRDAIKLSYCRDNGIKLVIIPYWNYNDIENILVSELFGS